MTREDQPQGSRQRIDKWLFFARIAKSRALAQALVEASAVTINGQACSHASRMVKVGDRIDVMLERQDLCVVVKASGERRGPSEEARQLYEDRSLPAAERPRLTPFEMAQRVPLQGKSQAKPARRPG